MSITAYTGLPRSGKSYSAVENLIIPALKSDRAVYHNMKLNDEKLMLLSEGRGSLHAIPAKISAAELVTLVPPGAVFVGDELWRYWPAGMTAKQVPEAQLEFFTMHGHKVGEDGRTQELCLITQDLSQIASFIRCLVEQTFRTTKLSAVGQDKRFRVDVYQGPVTGQSPPASKMLRQMYGKYRPEIYDCYVSHTMSETGAAGSEERPDKRGSILKGARSKFAVLALLLLPLGLWGFIHSLHSLGGRKPDPAGERSESAGSGQANATKQGLPVAPRPQWSTAWRLAGRLRVGLDDYYLVEGDGGGRRVERHQCKSDFSGNTICVVDGEYVAYWTGPKAGYVESALGHTTEGKAVSN